MDSEPQSPTSASTPSKTQLREQHTTAIQQISELFNVALEGNLQLDALQREVDLWKNSYMQAERGKNRLEQELELRKKSSLQQGDAGQAGGQGFTAVLVDGDGAVFDESLVAQGTNGGVEAAKLLLSSLPQLIQSTVPALAKSRGLSSLTSNLVVNVVVNRYGLAGAMVKGGLVRNFAQVNEFFMGFSKAHGSINVIDSGPGKEASDSKIMSQLRLYGSINQCSLIVLAASHDNGYANPIRSLTTEGKEIVLLKSVDVAMELQGLCPVGAIKGLFRDEKISLDAKAGMSAAHALHMGTDVSFGNPVVSTPKRSSGTSAMNFTALRTGKTPNYRDKPAVAVKSSDEEEEASEDYTDISDNDGGSDVEEIDFDTLDFIRGKVSHPFETEGVKVVFGGASNTKQQKPQPSQPLQQTAISNGKKEKKKNAGKKQTRDMDTGTGIGQDGKISIAADEKALRFLNPRPCHKHYLTHTGCDNKSCTFGHNYILNQKQLVYLARLVKDMPCPFAKLGRCTETTETCIYGHICPHANDCTWGAACRFKDLPDGGHGGWVLY